MKLQVLKIELKEDSKVFPWKKGQQFTVVQSVKNPDYYCIQGTSLDPWTGQHVLITDCKIIR